METAAAEREWAAALLKIRRRDPSIYDSATQLFSTVQEADEGSEPSHDPGRHKAKTLRQVLYDQVRRLFSLSC